MRRHFGPLATLTVFLVFLTGCPVPPLVVLPTELSKGVQLRSYTAQLSVEDGNAGAWSLVSGALPSGVSLDEETGMLSGVPIEFGNFTFGVQVSDLQLIPRVGEQSYTLEIIERLAVDSTLASAQVSVAYEQAIGVSGGVGPFTFALVGLPAGLSFDTSTGTISGIPVLADPSITLQVTVTDAGDPQQERVANLTLVIRPQPLSISTTTLPDGTVGEAYEQTIETADGRAPVQFRVAAGLLPDGLRLDTDSGVISGTPTAAGASTFTIEAEDSDDPANVVSQEYTVTVAE